MKNAIVTGANGFIGTAVVRELILSGYHVVALVEEGSKVDASVPSAVEYITFDLAKADEIPQLVGSRKYSSFYHFAWAGSAGKLRTDTRLQLNNAQWTIDCLVAAAKLGCERFICAGSIMEHETMAAVYTQGAKPGLGYVYGSGKLVSHAMSVPIAADLGIDLLWAEITNAYGPGEVSPRFVNSTIRKIITQQPLTFTSGTQNYDFVFIDDVARAFRLIGEKGVPFHHYLIGSGHAKPLKEFIMEMKTSIAPNMDFVFGNIPFTGTDLPLEKFDTTLTERDTGFKAEVAFGEGVTRTMEWIKNYDAEMGI